METMTRAQEGRLLKSIEQAIGLANNGVDPSEAIAKVAAQEKYSWDFTSRMVEAFNASKTMKWLRTVDGAEKAASFSIADPAKVRQALFPRSVETPAEKQAGLRVPTECYVTEPEFFQTTEKVAAGPVALGEPKVSWERHDLNMLFAKAQGEVAALERQVKEAKVHVAAAKARFTESLHKLAHYFRSAQHTPFQEVEKVATATWDNLGQLMDIVWHLSRADKFGEKRASGTPVKTLAPAREPYTFIEEILEKRAAYQETWDRCQELERGARTARTRLTTLERRCIEKSAGLNLMDPGAIVGGMTQAQAPAPYQGPDLDKVRAATQQAIADPQIVADNQAMDAQLMLHQLMTQDPVLSSRDPVEVIKAYNLLARSSPNLVSSPLALQATLRKYLEAGGMDPMDISNMATTEKSMAAPQMRGDRMMVG